jgi:hypothetical protein
MFLVDLAYLDPIVWNSEIIIQIKAIGPLFF